MNIRTSLAAAAIAACAALSCGAAGLAQAGTPASALPVTTAVIAAGGGAGRGSYSSVRAFTQMVGSDALQSELSSLRDKYGADNVDHFVHILDYAFIDGWKRAGQANVKMPQPSADTGTALMLDMVRAGTGTDHVFRLTSMMDALWSPRVHAQVQADVASKYGADAVTNFQRIGNQFFYDLAHSLGDSSVIPAAS